MHLVDNLEMPIIAHIMQGDASLSSTLLSKSLDLKVTFSTSFIYLFVNRNDELGIPFSVVIDKSTIDMACIGVRHRDSTLKVRTLQILKTTSCTILMLEACT